ncbi:helix-turn-helix transcriptional regulator [Paraliobacillus salinarum]|uniref:helix-turn-helix transcriptional regulator n=1 Tax=Paraliobacillus salinarum TaxID=1158996 RepID=UPI0015F6CE68|nr:helix-turn-helix transcriptional regulator [Paraliobacillus salinarum]
MNIKITPKGLRVSNDLTQEEVAEKLGISLTQYRRKENGKVRFYADEIYKLSQLYSVPVTIFFDKEVSL